MNKQEYMENFTKEQLVDKIVLLDTFFKQSNIFNSLQSDIQSPLAKSIADNYEAKIQQKEAKISKLEKEREGFRNQRDALLEETNKLKIEIKDLEIQIEEKYKPLETNVDKLSKNEKELSEENAVLYREIDRLKSENSKTIADYLPTEPIKVADMLISAEGEYECNSIEKAIFKSDKAPYNLFDVSELRQIAEHLLVYCNANESDGD